MYVSSTPPHRIIINSQIDNPDSYRESIPEATNRIPVSLIVVEAEEFAPVEQQVAEPGVRCIELHRTPPVAVVANIGE